MRRLNFTILLLLAFATFAHASAFECFDADVEYQKRIYAIHEHKGTFEKLIDLPEGSLAAQYPKAYSFIMRRFIERASFVLAVNRGNPPKHGTAMRELLRQIEEVGEGIAEDLEDAYDKMKTDRQAMERLRSYTDRFRKVKSWQAPFAPEEAYNRFSKRQFELMVGHGKAAIDSIWSELRVTLLLPNVIGVNITVRQMIVEQTWRNQNGELDKYLGQEFDHVWHPETDGGAMAIAFGDTKVFESVFNSKHGLRQKVRDQLQRYLAVAATAGNQLGMRPEVHYFFVAGITAEQVSSLQKITAEFNDKLKDPTGTYVLQPVKLVVHGVY